MVELADTQHLKCCARNEHPGSNPGGSIIFKGLDYVSIKQTER